MMEEISEALAPLILEVVSVLLTLVIGYLTIQFRRWTGIEIEAKHREALHSALTTGAARVIEAAGEGRITGVELDVMRDEVIAYVRRSVPDAIRNLVSNESILWDMAEARIKQMLAGRV